MKLKWQWCSTIICCATVCLLAARFIFTHTHTQFSIEQTSISAPGSIHIGQSRSNHRFLIISLSVRIEFIFGKKNCIVRANHGTLLNGASSCKNRKNLLDFNGLAHTFPTNVINMRIGHLQTHNLLIRHRIYGMN